MWSKVRTKLLGPSSNDTSSEKRFQDHTEGAFLGFEDGQVVGWAWDALRPDQILTVDLFADGVPIGSGRAEEINERAPKAVGGHVFWITCVNLDKVRPPFCLRGRIRESETELSSHLIIGAEAELRDWIQWYDGEVFSVEHGQFRGWALRPGALGEILTVEVRCDGRLIDTIPADQPEPYARHGAGHGFCYTVPLELLDGNEHEWSFSIAGTKFTLRRSGEHLTLVPSGQIAARLLELEQECRCNRKMLVEERARQAGALSVFSRELVKHVDAMLAIQRDAFMRELARLHPNKSGRIEVSPSFGMKERAVRIVMGDNIVGFGWHEAEKTEEEGTLFRWMSDTATLIVPFSSASGAHLDIHGIAQLDAHNGIDVHVNGVAIAGTISADAASAWRFRGDVPAAAFFGTPLAIVTLNADYSRPPLGSPDIRPLSFAVHAIGLEAIGEKGRSGDASQQDAEK